MKTLTWLALMGAAVVIVPPWSPPPLLTVIVGVAVATVAVRALLVNEL